MWKELLTLASVYLQDFAVLPGQPSMVAKVRPAKKLRPVQPAPAKKLRPVKVPIEKRSATVGQVDTSAFLGRWYQMYGSISTTFFTFGNDGPQYVCISADYSLNEDGETIDVLNQGLGPDGRVTKIYGQARATKNPSKRKVTFERFFKGNVEAPVPAAEGDFWIYKLGPKVRGKYAYAIIGGPLLPEQGLDKTQFWVVAREPRTFKQAYSEEVRNWFKENRFDWWWQKPVPTGSVGNWQWFPPSFAEGDRDRGYYGHEDCASVEELEPPKDGSRDPRINTRTRTLLRNFV